MSTDAQARSADDLLSEFMDGCRGIVRYWATRAPANYSHAQRLSGLMHSMLVMLDGCSSAFPSSIELVCRPHEDDKAFQQAEGEDWIEDGTVITDNVMLHELLYQDESFREWSNSGLSRWIVFDKDDPKTWPSNKQRCWIWNANWSKSRPVWFRGVPGEYREFFFEDDNTFWNATHWMEFQTPEPPQ
jgi:hypothetical protein